MYFLGCDVSKTFAARAEVVTGFMGTIPATHREEDVRWFFDGKLGGNRVIAGEFEHGKPPYVAGKVQSGGRDALRKGQMCAVNIHTLHAMHAPPQPETSGYGGQSGDLLYPQGKTLSRLFTDFSGELTILE
jgi:hypothetical protein